jgi:glucokinase
VTRPRRYVACLDIGGSSVKSAAMRDDGTLLENSWHAEAIDSGGSREQILGTFAAALGRQLELIGRQRLPLLGIGVSICGPFDYEQGISRITGLDKYEALYGVNVKQELRHRLELPADLMFLFDVDSWSFARGEVWTGAARGYRRAIVFTMGTGVGSAFAADGRIVSEGPGVPWYGWISGQKYRDGILNDYISRTHMVSRYEHLTGTRIDVREMAARADAGEPGARRVFEEVGEELGLFLRENHVAEFRAECLVFGGQISRSFHLFASPLRTALQNLSCLKAIIPAQDIDGSAIKGIGKYVLDGTASTASAGT